MNDDLLSHFSQWLSDTFSATASADKETDVFVSEVETWLKKSNILLTGYVFEYDTNLS